MTPVQSEGLEDQGSQDLEVAPSVADLAAVFGAVVLAEAMTMQGSWR